MAGADAARRDGGGALITGGTGFIGAALGVELLARDDAPVAFLVRGDAESARPRLMSALSAVASDYGLPPSFVADRRGRIEVLASAPLPQPAERLPRPTTAIREIWHCAASLRYAERARAEIFGTNVEGTRGLLDWAADLGVERFNHVSTAYVCGDRVGAIAEAPVDQDADTNNLYELSKIRAEQVVGAEDRIRTRIWRPSIVIGHSRTHRATSEAGLYGFIREMHRMAGRLARSGAASPEPMRLLLDPDTMLNFVPVDLMARQAVDLAAIDELDQVIHLTNLAGKRFGDALGLVCAAVNLPACEFVSTPADLRPADLALQSRLGFFAPYLQGTRDFEQRQAEKLAEPLRYDVTDEIFVSFVEEYLRRRADAREG